MAEEAVFSFILEALRDIVIQEAQFLDGVGDQVEKLEQQLNHMRWFLRDTAAANQDGQKRVLEWVLQVRNLAYQGEHLIESYALKVASRRRGGIIGTVKRFAGLLNECYHRHQLGCDIETLISKISDLTTSLDKYGIRQIMENKDDGTSRRPLLRRTYSTNNYEEDLFVGSDDATNILAEKLVSGQYRTVSLYGMGGLGKTTIARKVYHHPMVMKHFDGFSWVSVSQQWQKDDVLRGILIKLMGDQKREDIQKWRDEELVRELSHFLRTRRCLLVLDDVWSTDAWESIKAALPIREDGSKVLMTTRNMEVATFMDAHGYIYNPPLLTQDQSWELLSKKALRGQDSQDIMKMKQIGKEMVTQCGGLLLGVVALGGILSSRCSYSEWANVRDNIKSYLGNEKRDIHKILALSYDDLPFQLKPCFLYLSKYAEDAEIEVETLYQYWIAEGMVSNEDRIGSNETMMDVAEHYLRELAERCMVLVEKEEEHSLRRFKSCRLHDLMRDLCIFKAKEEKFLESIDFGNIHDAEAASSVSRLITSRLSIFLQGEDQARIFVPPTKAVSRSLRSFIIVMKYTYAAKRPGSLKFKLSEFVMLRVLALDGVGSRFECRTVGGCCKVLAQHMKFPLSIGKLIHLRYLSLKGNSYIIMTSSINNLKQLQTLDLTGCEFMWMPNVVWKLARLNHLYLPDIFPRHFAGMIEFDKLHRLEILEGFDNKVCRLNHLSTLTNLRKLVAIVEGKLDNLQEFINQVRKLSSLLYLGLTIKMDDLSSGTALALLNEVLYCSNLVDLKIEGKLLKLPEFGIGFGCNLRSLELAFCEMEENPLKTLEKLPKLRRLNLSFNSFAGKEMSCHGWGFPELRYLELSSLENLERWEMEDGAMRNLVTLRIYRCRRLEMIPGALRFATSLKKLDMISMPVEFKERVQVKNNGEEGPDFYKVRHVQAIT